MTGAVLGNKTTFKPLYRHPALVVAPCEYGLGVFAIDDIPADTTLEECHHLRIEEQNCLGIIEDYVYGLESEQNGSGETEACYSLPLGCGSIYNHAENHNIEYWHDTERDLIVFHTIKDIRAGDQLFVDYGREWWETREFTPDQAG